MDNSTKLEQYWKIPDIIFSDPFSQNTRKTRLVLIIAASFAILVNVYHLKMTQTPIFQLQIPEGTPDILSGALSVTVVYLLMEFLFFAWQDYRRLKCRVDIITIQSSFALMIKINAYAHNIECKIDQIGKILSDSSQQKQYPDLRFEVPKLINIANETLLKLLENQKKIDKLDNDKRVLIIVQWIRLAVIDIGIPLFIGIVAVFKSCSAIIPFIKVIF